MKDEIISKKLEELSKSKFRNSFHLNKKMINYIELKGINRIKEHMRDFIRDKLEVAYPKNDGKQTPMKGHPVFIAMHACACCCRSCLYKWHGIKKEKELSQNEVNYIMLVLLTWIKLEYKKSSENR